MFYNNKALPRVVTSYLQTCNATPELLSLRLANDISFVSY